MQSVHAACVASQRGRRGVGRIGSSKTLEESTCGGATQQGGRACVCVCLSMSIQAPPTCPPPVQESCKAPQRTRCGLNDFRCACPDISILQTVRPHGTVDPFVRRLVSVSFNPPRRPFSVIRRAIPTTPSSRSARVKAGHGQFPRNGVLFEDPCTGSDLPRAQRPVLPPVLSVG